MRDEPLTFASRPGASPDTRIIALEGPLTLANMFALQKALMDGSERVTILDLSGTPYMDSAGLGAILNYYVHAQRKDRVLRLVGVNKRVGDLFEVTHVQSLLSRYDSVEAAEAAS